MTAEEERTRLIGAIARVLSDGPVPEEARAAALTFIGWLARRMPGEPVSHCDVRRCKGVSLVLTVETAAYQGPPSGSMPRSEYLDGPERQAFHDGAVDHDPRPKPRPPAEASGGRPQSTR